MRIRTIHLTSGEKRLEAADMCRKAPYGHTVSFKPPSRTLEQNEAMWAMLTDISRQVDWHGQTLSPTDWKDWMMHALKRSKWVPDEDGGMVPVGMSTSKLGKGVMSELLALIDEFGARHGVKWSRDDQC